MDNNQKKLSLRPNRSPSLPPEATEWIETREPVETSSTSVPPQSKKLKRITFEVYEDYHHDVKALAASKGLSIRELMISLLDKELRKSKQM